MVDIRQLETRPLLPGGQCDKYVSHGNQETGCAQSGPSAIIRLAHGCGVLEPSLAVCHSTSRVKSCEYNHILYSRPVIKLISTNHCKSYRFVMNCKQRRTSQLHLVSMIVHLLFPFYTFKQVAILQSEVTPW